MEYDDVISSGIFTDEFCDKGPWEWMNQDLITVEEAMEVYIIEVVAECHC